MRKELNKEEIQKIIDDRLKAEGLLNSFSSKHIVDYEFKDIMKAERGQTKKQKDLVEGLFIFVVILTVFAAFMLGLYIGRLYY